jgi:hypothetical protein
MFTGVKLSGNNEFSTLSNDTKTNYTIENDFIPYGFSGNRKVNGKILFVGYGISAPDQNYDDYIDKNGNPIDTKGKILLMMNILREEAILMIILSTNLKP